MKIHIAICLALVVVLALSSVNGDCSCKERGCDECKFKRVEVRPFPLLPLLGPFNDRVAFREERNLPGFRLRPTCADKFRKDSLISGPCQGCAVCVRDGFCNKRCLPVLPIVGNHIDRWARWRELFGRFLKGEFFDKDLFDGRDEFFDGRRDHLDGRNRDGRFDKETEIIEIIKTDEDKRRNHFDGRNRDGRFDKETEIIEIIKTDGDNRRHSFDGHGRDERFDTRRRHCGGHKRDWFLEKEREFVY